MPIGCEVSSERPEAAFEYSSTKSFQKSQSERIWHVSASSEKKTASEVVYLNSEGPCLCVFEWDGGLPIML